MSTENEKAETFVRHLWQNPSLIGLSPLQKEEQLQQFLDLNAQALAPTMSSPEYFPNLPWPRVRSLLGSALSELANSSLTPLCRAVLDKNINFTFTVHMARRSASLNEITRQFGDFLQTLSEKNESRRELTGPLMAAASGMVDRYLKEILERRKYISFELRKVQRLKISPDQIGDLVKATMLIRPSVHYFSPPAKNLLHISPNIAQKLVSRTSQILTLIPEAVSQGGVNSTLAFQENRFMESTARLAAVFSFRCRNLRPGMKADRGAESSDKSWFNIARKNYKYYGFDPDILVELHAIAADNRW